MLHICVLLHGIEAEPKDCLWNEELAVFLYEREPNICWLPRKYGYIGGREVWAYPWARDSVVEHERSYIYIMKDLYPQARFSMIAHSLGGYIACELLKTVKLHNLVLIGSAAPEDFDWNAVSENFNGVHNYYSPNDEVLRESWSQEGLGLMGLKGASVKHPYVHNTEMGWKHDEFMDLTEMQRMARVWIASIR